MPTSSPVRGGNFKDRLGDEIFGGDGGAPTAVSDDTRWRELDWSLLGEGAAAPTLLTPDGAAVGLLRDAVMDPALLSGYGMAAEPATPLLLDDTPVGPLHGSVMEPGPPDGSGIAAEPEAEAPLLLSGDDAAFGPLHETVMEPFSDIGALGAATGTAVGEPLPNSFELGP